MMSSARRAFSGMIVPGIVMSILVNVPALAASAHNGGGMEKNARPEPKTMMHHSVSQSIRTVGGARMKQSVRMSAVRPQVATDARSRKVIHAVTSPPVRFIRRVSLRGVGGKIDKTLIDDGTLWRQTGSLATWQQTGVASWYGGKRWQGHETSSGSRFDQNALTAAHATLPLGTKVLVVRNDGRRSVIVTINDRPGTRTRIIDLSRAAAKALGILDAGTAMVTLQPL